MVRSIWKKTVLGVLASTGLAWGQQTVVPPAPVGDTVGRIITVSEMGKPGQRCKVMREWKMADGAVARQVVDLNTGEKMTIVETGVLSSPMPGQPAGNVKSIASRIYHWGRSETSPMGVPMPPMETEAPVMAATTPAPEKKTTEVVLPPVQKTAQTTTPVSPYAPSRSSVSGDDKNTIVLPAVPTVVQNQEPPKPAYTVPRSVWNQAPATTPAKTNPPATVTQAPVQPAQPSDWRKSWGKLPEHAKADDTVKKTDGPSIILSDAPPKTKTDPLSDPLPYTKVAVEEKINAKMNLPKLPDEKPTKAAKTTPDLLPPLPPLEKPLPVLPPVKQVEPPAVAVVTPSVVPLPVVTPPAPVATRSSLHHDKVAAPNMPTPEPVGRVVIHNAVSPVVDGSQANTQHLVHILHDSIYPSQRESAADQLGDCDWKENAPVVEALVTAANEDPAATVRACCVRCLGRMHANSMPVVQAVRSLKADSDPRVRTEVQEALAILCSGQPIEPTPEK